MAKGRARRKPAADEIVVFAGGRGEDTEGAVRGLKPLPDQMKQGPYESQEQFINRLNRLVGKAMGEAEIEQKFDVDFCPKTASGAALPVKSGRSERKQLKRREQGQKRKAKRLQTKQNQADDFGQVKADRVRFGERAHAPPNMDAIRQKFNDTIKKINAKKARSMKL